MERKSRVTADIWWYGLGLAVLALVLKIVEYHFWVRDPQRLFFFFLAILFTLVGIWIGQRVFGRRPSAVFSPEPTTTTAEPEPPSELTEREYEVLRLMAQGHSNAEIAERLFISVNTVKTHSANIFAKLDVRRRTQAVSRARELGWV